MRLQSIQVNDCDWTSYDPLADICTIPSDNVLIIRGVISLKTGNEIIRIERPDGTILIEFPTDSKPINI